MAHYDVVPLLVADHPADRPEWVRETIRGVVEAAEGGRARLLALVAAAPDEALVAGTDEDWGLGQVAVHLLIVERGVFRIVLGLARGERPSSTGQPRPPAHEVTRAGIAALAERARRGAAELVAEFPADPDTATTAAHPFYGEMNCFGWLLTQLGHYRAHLDALRRGERSAL